MPSKKILLVDDDPDILSGVGDRLRSYGLDVRCESTAAGCFAALRQETPDLLLLDIRLPDGNGLDILSDLKATYPALPVLIISSSTRTAERESLRRGAQGFISKPFKMEELKRQVFKVLGEPG